MPLFGEGSCDIFVGDAFTSEIEHPVGHLRAARELGDGIHSEFDFKVAYGTAAPDNPDRSDIVLAALQHDLLNEAAQ